MTDQPPPPPGGYPPATARRLPATRHRRAGTRPRRLRAVIRRHRRRAAIRRLRSRAVIRRRRPGRPAIRRHPRPRCPAYAERGVHTVDHASTGVAHRQRSRVHRSGHRVRHRVRHRRQPVRQQRGEYGYGGLLHVELRGDRCDPARTRLTLRPWPAGMELGFPPGHHRVEDIGKSIMKFKVVGGKDLAANRLRVVDREAVSPHR